VIVSPTHTPEPDSVSVTRRNSFFGRTPVVVK
jgi:hypothetical protein